MTFLVKDILDYAEMQEKPLTLNYQQVDIFELINECINILILKALQKGLRLSSTNHSV
jgi:signal transduction histidine kinase